jgi:hypothetical protein
VRLQAEQIRLQDELARRDLQAAMANPEVLKAIVRFDLRRPETLEEVQSALERTLGPEKAVALRPYVLGESIGIWTQIVNRQAALMNQARDAVAIERERLQMELLRRQLKTQDELLNAAGQVAFHLELQDRLSEDMRHAFERLGQLTRDDLAQVAASGHPRGAAIVGERFARNVSSILFGTEGEDAGKPVGPLLKQVVASAIWRAWLESNDQLARAFQGTALTSGEAKAHARAALRNQFMEAVRNDARLRSTVRAILGDPVNDKETARLLEKVAGAGNDLEKVIRRGVVSANVYMHVYNGVRGVLTNPSLPLKYETLNPLRVYRGLLEQFGDTVDQITARPGAEALVHYKDLLSRWVALEVAALEMAKLGTPAQSPQVAQTPPQVVYPSAGP